MPTIQRLVGVDDDIAELAAYLLSYSEPVALRFVDSVQSTLKQLAEMPGIGSLKALRTQDSPMCDPGESRAFQIT
jgi:plasmid stabilization system protein ParE